MCDTVNCVILVVTGILEHVYHWANDSILELKRGIESMQELTKFSCLENSN